jgi:hypothetical protein
MYKQIEMNWACHTRHRFCLAVIVSMLFCGLSSSEIPELTRLVDDTSNDFTVLVVTKASVCVATNVNPISIVSVVQQKSDRLEYRLPPSVSVLDAQSPTGYLQLLCVHRT